jgi:hypothetical protein
MLIYAAKKQPLSSETANVKHPMRNGHALRKQQREPEVAGAKFQCKKGFHS